MIDVPVRPAPRNRDSKLRQTGAITTLGKDRFMRRSLTAAFLVIILVPPFAVAESAFRFTDLDLRDPHFYVSLPLLGCRDLTDDVPLGLAPSFNETTENSITSDGDGDGYLDLSPLIYFPPDDQAVGFALPPGGLHWDPTQEEGELVFHFAGCLVPFEAPMCEPDLANEVNWLGYFNSESDTLLGILPGTTGSYSPAITIPDAPCFVTEPFDGLLLMGGVPIQLTHTQLSATYRTDPSPELVDGLLRGFLTEAVADVTIIPEHVDFVGGQPLSSVLPGGTGCCAPYDDRDLSPTGSELGWWCYLNFEATEVFFLASTDVSEIATRTASVVLSAPWPNPFQRRTDLVFSLPTSMSVFLSIVDVTGRRIATLADGTRAAGVHGASWAGVDALGRQVAAGVYFVHLQTPLGARTQKVVLAR